MSNHHLTPEQEALYGPNVVNVRAGGSRVVRGKMPAQVRKQFMKAVKDGVLGHLKRPKGLNPGFTVEVFYHPDHKNEAIERQKKEYLYNLECFKQAALVMVVRPFEDLT